MINLEVLNVQIENGVAYEEPLEQCNFLINLFKLHPNGC